MGFVELTLMLNGYSVYLNISRIEAITQEEKGCNIWVQGDADGKYVVRESYEEVKSLINAKIHGGRR